MKKKQRALRIAALTMALLVAQAAYAADGRRLDVPAGDLVSALQALSQQSDAKLVYDAGQLQGLQTQGVSGQLSASDALAKLLEGAALRVSTRSSGEIVISTGDNAGSAKPEAGVASLEKLTVTGSRLTQMGVDSVTPVRQVDREDVIESGQMDLAEALRDVPGVSGNDSLNNNQGSIQGNGLSTIALRGLGLARTLVLIDGRRTVSNAGNRNVVNLSSIPEYMINRVDVTTGGASAVYGSDAIAGVVNIVTEDRMDGFRARVVGRDTHDGGGESIEYSIGAGSRFLDDRLYLMGALTYSDQGKMVAADRDWAMVSSSYSAVTNVLTTPNLGAYPAGGRYAGNGFFYDEEGLKRNFVTQVNGYDTRGPGVLTTPRETINAGSKFIFDVNDDVQLYGHAMYSAVDTRMEFAPVTSAYSETYGVNGEFEVGRIPRYNPYAPAVISAAVTNAGITWFRRFNELGNRMFDNHRVTWRGALGMRGTLFDGMWDWDVSYGYGYFNGHQTSTNYLNLVNLQNSLNATVVNGAIVCADAAARAAGCVALNPFGVGTVSEEAADYIRSNKEFWARNRQHTFEASITGSPFSMPAGDVQTAFGIEWRRDQTSSKTDDLTQLGISSGPFIPDFEGRISSKAAYGEARVPLLRNLPMVHDLALELAVRVNDYPELENVGTTWSYRTGLQWALTKDVVFRAAYGLAQRAPYTTELYSPPRDGYSTVVDACHDVRANTPGAVAEGCRKDPLIAAAIAENGRFIQDSTYVFTPASGNLNLKEEEAHTLTAGFVFAPWKGMEASADYYDIKIKDAINSIGIPALMLECYSNPDGLDNKFCAPIRRNAEGQIIRIDSQQQNLNTMRASGIDVAFKQGFDLQNLGIPGKFTLNGSFTRRLRLETTFEGVAGMTTTTSIGEVGTFKNEAKFGLAWSNRPLRIKWSSTFMGKAIDSNARKLQFETAGITNPLFLHVPSFVRHDLNVTVFPIKTGNVDWRVFGNVLNIFNRYGPYLPTGTASGSTHNYNSAYGVSGRTYSLGIEVRL